jgi:uncharacterized protein YbjT (DUF2867 family)
LDLTFRVYLQSYQQLNQCFLRPISSPLAVGIVGGLGFLGRNVLQTLLAQPDRFVLTLLNRATSNALCPPEVRVISADWSNENGLQTIGPVVQGLYVLVSLVGGNVAPDVSRNHCLC